MFVQNHVMAPSFSRLELYKVWVSAFARELKTVAYFRGFFFFFFPPNRHKQLVGLAKNFILGYGKNSNKLLANQILLVLSNAVIWVDLKLQTTLNFVETDLEEDACNKEGQVRRLLKKYWQELLVDWCSSLMGKENTLCSFTFEI